MHKEKNCETSKIPKKLTNNDGNISYSSVYNICHNNNNRPILLAIVNCNYLYDCLHNRKV